jgi:hypothetical protein
MLKEALFEAKRDQIWKYIPKKYAKKYDTIMKEIDTWLDAMRYPYSAGWFGHYGEKAGRKLEFNVKTWVDYDEELVDLVGGQERLNDYMNMYFEIEREDLAEVLKETFKISVFGYDGRSGGYLLLDDWEDYIFKGTKVGEISIWDDDNYGDPVEEVMDYQEELEQIIADLSQEGPLGEFWDDYVQDLESLLEEGSPYEIDIIKNPTKIMAKNYDILEKTIEHAVNGFNKGFEEFVKTSMEDM